MNLDQKFLCVYKNDDDDDDDDLFPLCDLRENMKDCNQIFMM